MPDKQTLLEPSFVEAITAIEQSSDLTKSMKRHWVCSLRQIGGWLDRPFELVPARWTSIRLPVSQLHHARLGVTAKTVANHKSNVAAALRWFGKEHQVSPRGVALTVRWAGLRDGIDDRGRRARLYGLMRYCSGRGLEPAAVDDAVLQNYLRYRAETTSLAASTMAQRSIARAWNVSAHKVADWPTQRLKEPPVKASEGPAWEEFPEGLRRDIDTHLAGLARMRRGSDGKRIRPCSPKTIKTRRAELVAVARMAVRIGTPIESLTSLAALLDPDVVGPVLDAYWKKNGEEPNVYTIDLGSKLLSLAKQIGLGETAIERLDDIRAALEEHRHGGFDRQEPQADPAGVDGRHLERSGVAAERLDAASPRRRGTCSGQGSGDGADRGCHRYSFPCSGPVDQSRLHRTGKEPDQARRPDIAVLADVPALRRQEQGQPRFYIR